MKLRMFSISRASLPLACAIAALLASTSLHAADLTWDDGASTGNWNTTDLNWTGEVWDNDAPDDAIFDATGVGTVSLTEAITAGSLTFNTTGYTIDTDAFGLTLNIGITANQNAVIESDLDGSMILGADNEWFVANTRTLTVSSDIGGDFGITKSGGGTLILSGANTYIGDTNLNGGTLVVSNATAFGPGVISVTGNSRINASTTLTYANDISIDEATVLSLQAVGANNTTATFSGAITGDGGITQLAGSNARTIALTSASNTFTGNLSLAPGTGSNDFLTFASIGDGGSIIFNRSSWRSAATYTGAEDLEFETRTLSLATTFGGATGIDGGGNPINMFANNGAGTVTINTDVQMTTTTSSGFLWLGGTNTGNNTFAGAIADPTGTNTLSIGKFDAGKWILSNNANSYEGMTWIARGTLSVGMIDEAGNAQPLGQGSIIRMGFRNADIGTLDYTGAANASTDKQIEVGDLSRANNGNFRGGGVILNNGTGTLAFSNDTFNSTVGVVNTGTGHVRNLTLSGTNTGANTISGTIQNNNTVIGAIVELTKTGTGTWILEGENTYTGATAINGGTLILTGATQATSAITFGGGILGLDVASSVTAASATVNFTGQSVLITGSPSSASYTLLTANSITGTPTLAAPAPAGYELEVVGNELRLVQTGLTGYDLWASVNAPAGNPDDDFDGDGVPNAIEFVLGGDKDTNDLSKLPVPDASGSNLTFTFVRDQDSIGPNTVVTIEVGTTLDAWPDSYTVPNTPTAGPPVSVVDNLDGTDTVTLTLAKDPDDKKFARLKVEITP